MMVEASPVVGFKESTNPDEDTAGLENPVNLVRVYQRELNML